MENPFEPYEMKEELEKFRQHIKELESKIYTEEPGQEMLFFDSISGLYFYSTKERINKVNQQLTELLNDSNEVTLNDYLKILGLYHFQNSITCRYRNNVGWKVKEKLPDAFFDIIHDVTFDGELVDIIVLNTPLSISEKGGNRNEFRSLFEYERG